MCQYLEIILTQIMNTLPRSYCWTLGCLEISKELIQDQSYLTDQARYKVWKPYKCYRAFPHAVWCVTWPNTIALCPWYRHVHVQCMVLSWQSQHHGKNKAIKATKMKHLGSWPVYVRRWRPADWLVSEQRPPSYKQDLSCMKSTNEDTKPQWCHWQVQVCIQ